MVASSSKQWGSPAQHSAPSKLNCPVSVPATALTLTAVRTAAEPPYAGGAQDTVVADVHALLPHASAVVSEAVAVGPAVPKLSPLIGTVPPPLGAALAEVDEVVLTTGAAEANTPCSAAVAAGSGAAQCSAA